MKRAAILFLFVLLCTPVRWAGGQQANQQTGLLSPAQLQAMFPATVYFGGQMTTVQMRNTGGVRWREGKQTLFGMVDAGGYSSGVKERYQFYILSDVALEIGGKRLPAGAYGAGFLSDQGFEVMDLGGTELFHASVQHDSGMKRPRPLQVTASGDGRYRLYVGRDYVELVLDRASM